MTGPIMPSIVEFPWAVESRIACEPIYALFREREDAEEMAYGSFYLRVIRNPAWVA